MRPDIFHKSKIADPTNPYRKPLNSSQLNAAKPLTDVGGRMMGWIGNKLILVQLSSIWYWSSEQTKCYEFEILSFVKILVGILHRTLNVNLSYLPPSLHTYTNCNHACKLSQLLNHNLDRLLWTSQTSRIKESKENSEENTGEFPRNYFLASCTARDWHFIFYQFITAPFTSRGKKKTANDRLSSGFNEMKQQYFRCLLLLEQVPPVLLASIIFYLFPCLALSGGKSNIFQDQFKEKRLIFRLS